MERTQDALANRAFGRQARNHVLYGSQVVLGCDRDFRAQRGREDVDVLVLFAQRKQFGIASRLWLRPRLGVISLATALAPWATAQIDWGPGATMPMVT